MAFGIKLVQGGVTLAAGTAVHPAPISVDANVICYLSFTGTTSSYRWSMTVPLGHSVISSASSALPSFTPDLISWSGTITLIDDAENSYVLDVVTATVAPTASSGSVIYSAGYGVKADGRKITDGVLTAGSNVLSSATAAFTAADVGRLIVVRTPQSALPTGTVSISTAGPPYAITGSSTLFTTEIPNTGGTPDNGGAVYVDGDWFTISNVNSNTSLSVNQPASHNASGKTLYRDTQIATTIVSVTDATHAVLGVTGATILVSGTGLLATIASDDTAAVNLAHAAGFTPGAGEVVHPAGIIGLTSNLSYTNKTTPIRIRGQGMLKTFFTRMRVASENPTPTGNNFGMFSFDTCSGGIELRDFAIDGSVPVMGMNRTTAASNSQQGIAIFDSPNTSILRIGGGGFGTRDEFIYANPPVVTASDNLRVEGCDILANSIGPNLAAQGVGLVVHNNRVVAGQVAFELEAKSAIVSGNTFEIYSTGGYASGASHAIIVPILGDNLIFQDNKFIGGIISSAGNAVLGIDGVAGSAHDATSVILFQGNQYLAISGLFDLTDKGIIQSKSFKGTLIITGETFDRCTSTSTGGAFINITGANTGDTMIGPCKFRGRAGSNMTKGVVVKSDVPVGAVTVAAGSVFGESVTTKWELNVGASYPIDRVHQFEEITDPAAPATNQARLYAKDNGGGKTQLVVRFPTGAVQVIATEP